MKKELIQLALPFGLMMLALVPTGCRTERIVTVPEYHETIVHQRDTVSTVDSVYVQDSVLILKLHDTVYITRTRVEYRDRWRDRLRVDSFIQRDSIPVIVEVEKPPSRWQRLTMRVGKAVMLLGILSVAGGGLFLFVRYKLRL